MIEAQLERIAVALEKLVAALETKSDEVKQENCLAAPEVLIMTPERLEELKKLRNNFGYTLVKSLTTAARALEDRSWKPSPATLAMMSAQYGIDLREVHAVIDNVDSLRKIFLKYPQTGYASSV